MESVQISSTLIFYFYLLPFWIGEVTGIRELKITHAYNQPWDFIKIQTSKDANYLVLSDGGILITLKHMLSFPLPFLTSSLPLSSSLFFGDFVGAGLEPLVSNNLLVVFHRLEGTRDTWDQPHLIRIEFWKVIRIWKFTECHLSFLSRARLCQMPRPLPDTGPHFSGSLDAFCSSHFHSNTKAGYETRANPQAPAGDRDTGMWWDGQQGSVTRHETIFF